MPLEKFSCTKPGLNIALLGHQGQGKTTLAAALLKAQAEKGLARPLSRGAVAQGGYPNAGGPLWSRLAEPPPWSEEDPSPTRKAAHVACESPRHHLALVDCPGAAGSVGQVLRAARVDGAVLVVSALGGATPQGSEHLFIARHLGVRQVVIFINQCDALADPRALDQVELQARALLSAHGFDGHKAPVIRGAALPAFRGEAPWRAALDELLDALDFFLPEPRPGGPFLMPIQAVCGRIECISRGTIVCGVVERGLIPCGSEAEIVGLIDPVRTMVTALTTFRKTIERGDPGRNVGCLVRGIARHDIRPGQALVAPGSVTPRRHFFCEVTLRRPDQGGRPTPFTSGYRPIFHLLAAAVQGVCGLAPGARAEPGATLSMEVRLLRPAVLFEGTRLALREGNQVVGTGVVSALGP